ncbi:SAC3 domain-containing protein 1 isoform X2 [Orussus abietinus]|uniref:SAC3 domain-containing protein 1 isoform X2 n=1 Tax=Orussus abietinus TaxID=222816 RepID=UPI000625B8FA|nr:SAC3 domain-containing protein 1 isoform X2 [Orussus abietinus]
MWTLFIGTAFSCSKKREREGLLHILEIDESTKHRKRPAADPTKTVKCFARPAAGQTMPDLSELRPGPVLGLTIRFLFKQVLTRSDINWVVLYDFTFDRLRAVRQDIIIQRIDTRMSISLFEPIVRFYIYSEQRLCERDIKEFDPVINNKHLLECIKHLLALYDEQEIRERQSYSDICKELDNWSITDNRTEMETIYILLHLGNPTAISRGLELPSIYRSKMVKTALKISLAWYLRNYARACRMIRSLPPLLTCAALCNLRQIRRTSLQIMSSGFNSKNLTFPGLKLQELLLYNDVSKLKADCELFGLNFTNENVQFEKSKFKEDVSLATPEAFFNARELHKLLPEILLDSN